MLYFLLHLEKSFKVLETLSSACTMSEDIMYFVLYFPYSVKRQSTSTSEYWICVMNFWQELTFPTRLTNMFCQSIFGIILQLKAITYKLLVCMLIVLMIWWVFPEFALAYFITKVHISCFTCYWSKCMWFMMLWLTRKNSFRTWWSMAALAVAAMK